jgi:hypothetical protein
MDIITQNQPITPNVTVPNSVPVQDDNSGFKTPTSPCCASSSILLIVFLLLGALASGIYLGRTYFSSPNLFSKPIPSPTIAVASPSAMPTTDPIANWKTYENNIFSFEFKYPVDFVLKDTLPTKITVTSPKENLELKDATKDIEMIVDVNQAGYGPFFPNEIWDLDYSNEKGIFPIKETEQDIKQYRQDNYFEIRTSAKTIANRPLSFMFRFPKTIDSRQLFSQILSTFKFIETPPEIKNSDM